ncbi:MAG: gliding motility-associated C-terminal domain-containing protein, partial [Bacteroidales bacterium]
EIVNGTNNSEVEIRRGHQSQRRGKHYGIRRYYTFNPPIDLQRIGVEYFSTEDNGIISPIVASYSNGEWITNEPTSSSNFKDAIGLANTERITVFEEPQLEIPKSFTPNGDGINDYLVITGLEKYPNCRFIIFSQKETTRILFDKTPYQNDFDGAGFPSQTYFYIFYKDAKESKKTQKGYFELVR